jgi:hypothetical protein
MALTLTQTPKTVPAAIRDKLAVEIFGSIAEEVQGAEEGTYGGADYRGAKTA